MAGEGDAEPDVRSCRLRSRTREAHVHRPAFACASETHPGHHVAAFRQSRDRLHGGLRSLLGLQIQQERDRCQHSYARAGEGHPVCVEQCRFDESRSWAKSRVSSFHEARRHGDMELGHSTPLSVDLARKMPVQRRLLSEGQAEPFRGPARFLPAWPRTPRPRSDPCRQVGRAVEHRVVVTGEIRYRENGTLVGIRAQVQIIDTAQPADAAK
jgi:hypothetical protein